MTTDDSLNNEEQTTDAGYVTAEEQADQITEEVFGSDANSQATAKFIANFTNSYEENKYKKPLDRWLIDEFQKYPNIWKDTNEAKTAAFTIIDSIQASNEAKRSLYEHIGKGKSRESWLARRIEQGVSAAGVVDTGAYAGSIDQAVTTANQKMASTIFTKTGVVSQNANLDGFIAEQHHANTFNFEATAKGAEYRARVLAPEPGQPYGKNSVDIGIYDSKGKLVRRYQSKYGSDADATQRLFDLGDYQGQGKLVPSEQVGKVKNASGVIEIDGIKSKPLSKAEAKALQQDAQSLQEIKKYEWNDVNRIEISRKIGKEAVTSAALAAAFQGVRILGRRTWNRMTDKVNPAPSQDIQEFFESSLESGAHVGIQVAVTGGIMVAAKNGLLGRAVQATPAGRIANMVYVGIENAKVTYKFSKGEINGEEAIDAMGSVTCSAIGSLMGAAEGAAIGASIGVVAGPVGFAIGGFVGAIAGGMAGSKIGEAVWEGGKAIQKVSVKVMTSLLGQLMNTAKAIGAIVNPLNRLA